MNDQEIKNILNDPKKMLDLLSLFHQLLHVYEAQKIQTRRPGIENVGLSDSINIQLNKQEVKQ